MSKFKKLDGTSLKIIAMICMLFDHIGALFFPTRMWMRAIGRIAFPIFAFCVSEGYIHSKNRINYLLRLGFFAFLSEIPFNLFVNDSILYFDYQNVMFTFFISILSLIIYEKITKNKDIIMYILGVIVVLIFSLISLILASDYGLYGVLLVFTYYIFNKKRQSIRILFGSFVQVFFNSVGIYLFSILSSLFLLLYNGRKGNGLKWLFYIFYPGHLLILYLIKRYLM